MSETIKWVTLTTVGVPEQLHLLRAKLEAEDIPTRTRDESTIQVDPLLSSALGGVKLEVPEENLEQARGFMAGMEEFQPSESTNGLLYQPSFWYIVAAVIIALVIINVVLNS